MYKLNLILTLVLISYSTLTAQSVEVSVEPSPGGAALETYSLHDGTLTKSGEAIRTGAGSVVQNVYSASLSRNGRFGGVLYRGDFVRAATLDSRGGLLKDVEVEYVRPEDGTLRLWVFNDGRFATRDNVANFTFFDRDGTVRFSHSNLSGSPDGEVASELVSDPSGRTVLLAVPRVNYGDAQGSTVRLVNSDEGLNTIYESRERQIRHIDITDDGSMILLLTVADADAPEILLLDRFGNEIAKLRSEEDLQGATISLYGSHITVWSASRVQVYDVRTGERIGSSTIRQELFYAIYSEPDSQVVVLTGRNRPSSGELHEIGVQAIDLERRAIARSESGESLSYLDSGRIRVTRTGDSAFDVVGMNRLMRIRTHF